MSIINQNHNRIRWQNALLCSGKQGPKGPVRLALITMCTRADNRTLEFYMTQHELADWMGCSLTQAKAHVKAALDSGWLVQTRKGNSSRASEYRLAFGATDNPEGVIPAPKYSDGAENRPIKGAENRPIKGAENRTPTTPQHTPLTTPLDIPSPQADDDDSVANAQAKTAMTEDWHVHGSHVVHGRRLGIESVTQLGKAFKAWAIDYHIVSSDWDKKFMALINCIGDETDIDRLDDYGYSGISDYIDYSLPDDQPIDAMPVCRHCGVTMDAWGCPKHCGEATA